MFFMEWKVMFQRSCLGSQHFEHLLSCFQYDLYFEYIVIVNLILAVVINDL